MTLPPKNIPMRSTLDEVPGRFSGSIEKHGMYAITISLLSNAEVLDIDQVPLGRQTLEKNMVMGEWE